MSSVPLVHQQTRFLGKNLAVPVLPLFGGGKEDLWQRPEWERILAQNTVIVCTPAVLDQALFHAYVNIPEVSLLIFDEAHHCKKNHPYAKIIRDYYLKSPEPRPRLFGMTASPVDSKKDIGETITDLETLLHCKIITTSDSSLFDHSCMPKDVVWQYSHRGWVIETEFYKKVVYIRNLIGELRADVDFALSASAELGTWFTDRTLSYIVGRKASEIDALIPKLEQGKSYLAITDGDSRSAAMSKVREMYNIVQQHHFGPFLPVGPLMSPKVKLLYENLRARYAEFPDTRTMVFVKQRWTAVLLCDAFKELSVPSIRPGILTGGGQLARENISAKKQEEVMSNFHAGFINILFATSVGEEGIDVPQCSLVVRFDPNTTTIQYVQSRGRARMKDSIYAHMIEEDNFEHREMMNYVKDSAEYLKKYCGDLAPDRLLGHGTKLQQMIARDNANSSFRTPKKAVCNFSNCLTILSRYAASVHTQEAMRSEIYQEDFVDVPENMFQFNVRIPTNELSVVKGAHGLPRPNKALAKRSAAFRCLLKLRHEKLLDDTLDSIFTKYKPANANARLAVSARKDAYDMKTKPDLWQQSLGSIPTYLFAVTVDIVPFGPLRHELAPMVLLTRLPLPLFPKFPVFLENGVGADVIVKDMTRTYNVSEDEIRLLTAYTLHAIFLDVFHKTYDFDAQQIGYWLVPKSVTAINEATIVTELVDFSALHKASLPRTKWSPGSGSSVWCNKFLVDPWAGRNRYFSESVVEGKGPFDQVPQEYLPKTGKKARATSIIYFTDSHWNNAKNTQWDRQAGKIDRNQPVLKAELQTVRRNFLDKPTEKERDVAVCWIAPEPLQIARLTPAAARTALVWPSVLHRLEQYLIVLEAINNMGLQGITSELALEAFTKDDKTDDSENQVHSGNCRGMGKNYERLEFIGDSLLKMTSTIAVFNRTTCDEEGMHCRRMEILCNRTLFNVATTTHELQRYIRSESFNRNYWYPENLLLLSGRGSDRHNPVKHAAKTHQLRMKTIADVCEAIIGAAVIASKGLPVETRFDLGIRAITMLVESDDHDIQRWSEFPGMYNPPSWQFDQGDPRANDLERKVREKIGYTFKYPRLIRSAFTHSSDTNAPVPDLQRMEFLGDACLDWVSIWWLFDTNSDRNPQWLTEHKMAMVSNKFLAALAVTLDFHKIFSPTTVKLVSNINDYAEEATKKYQDFKDGKCGPDFWTKIDKAPPKALADLVESTLGAILIDSDFRMQPLIDFFQTHVLRFFRDISLYDGFANQHPTSYIYKKLTDEYGCQDFKVMNTDAKEGSIETIITAGVLIHDTVVAKSKGASAKYAKVRASQRALQLLDGVTRKEFRERFGCQCARGAAMEAAEARI